MTSEISTLHQRFPGLWPDAAPPSILALTEMPVGDIRHLATTSNWTDDELRRVLDTRSDAIVSSHAGAKVSLNSPAAIRRLFDQGVVRAVAHKWVTYALDRNHQRALTPTPSGELRYVSAVSDIVPDAAWLAKKAPLPDGGSWLLLFGGSPAWLKPEDTDRLNDLVATGAVTDVVYRHLRKKEQPITYSTRAGCGAAGTLRVEWPS